MMISPKQCLIKAEECAQLTRYADTPQMRVARANAERTWWKLADQCRQLEKLIEAIEGPATVPAMDSDRADLDPSPPKQQDDIAARLTAELAAEVRRLSTPSSHTLPAREVFKR